MNCLWLDHGSLLILNFLTSLLNCLSNCILSLHFTHLIPVPLSLERPQRRWSTRIWHSWIWWGWILPIFQGRLKFPALIFVPNLLNCHLFLLAHHTRFDLTYPLLHLLNLLSYFSLLQYIVVDDFVSASVVSHMLQTRWLMSNSSLRWLHIHFP